MSKTRSFSIYLLKDSFNAGNALKEGHSLDNKIGGDELPSGASLFILDNAPASPWWRSYFGIKAPLLQTLKGAVVFLPVSGRTFAMTFGHVHHNLDDASYEYDFGLRVTLNCLDPDKLKSTDILEPNGARRQRTQVPVDSDLTYFDFDRDTTILKSLTGKVREEYKSLFKHATGASSIRISSDVLPDGLPELCEKLLELYQDESYKQNFPNIQNIAPVRDPSVIASLEAKLLEALRAKSDHLALSVPEILDYHDGLWATFAGAGHGLVYDDVFMGRYYEYLQLNGVDLDSLDVEALKKHSLLLTDEDGQSNGERHSLFKCLIFDTALKAGSETYHLCDGNWYLIDSEFVTRLSSYLDPLCAASTLPNFTHKDEGDYNATVGAGSSALVCLDKKNIAPKGQKAVEPCDIYELRDGKGILHHIKISTLSAQLSHLFNQGTNSIHLLRDQDEARQRLRSLVQAAVPANNAKAFVAPIDADDLKVVFSIITHKEDSGKSGNLPLFSQISLMRAMKDMRRMGVDAVFCFIKDETPTSVGKKKKRKPKAKDDADNDNGAAEAA